MTIVLPALAVVFAAFCVWLGVRVFNRRERWAMWTAAATLCAVALIAASQESNSSTRRPKRSRVRLKLTSPLQKFRRGQTVLLPFPAHCPSPQAASILVDIDREIETEMDVGKAAPGRRRKNYAHFQLVK